MAQLMPLPLTVSCFSKIQIVLPFWYRLTWVVLEKGPLNGCVCVCMCMGQRNRSGQVSEQAPQWRIGSCAVQHMKTEITKSSES